MLFKSSTLQQTIPSGSEPPRPPAALQSLRKSKRQIIGGGALCVCAAFAFSTLPIANASTQSPDISSLEAYVDAIKQPRVSDQIGSMEHFLQVAGQSTLRLDALEILVMDYQKMNDSEHAVARAHDLLNFDASNPLAIAVLNASGSPASSRKARNDEFAAAKRGLGNVDLLHKPEGVSQAQFTQLQQNVRGMLAGAIGMGYLDQQDYEKATTYLQQALAADPTNGRYNYGLAQAILAAPNGGTADAYWLMAKAVNMAKGTPNEQEIARDALRNIVKMAAVRRSGTSFWQRPRPRIQLRRRRTEERSRSGMDKRFKARLITLRRATQIILRAARSQPFATQRRQAQRRQAQRRQAHRQQTLPQHHRLVHHLLAHLLRVHLLRVQPLIQLQLITPRLAQSVALVPRLPAIMRRWLHTTDCRRIQDPRQFPPIRQVRTPLPVRALPRQTPTTIRRHSPQLRVLQRSTLELL